MKDSLLTFVSAPKFLDIPSSNYISHKFGNFRTLSSTSTGIAFPPANTGETLHVCRNNKERLEVFHQMISKTTPKNDHNVAMPMKKEHPRVDGLGAWLKHIEKANLNF